MSAWSRWRVFPPPAEKLPPPEHGIKVKKPGTTWWGQKWIEALERISMDYKARLARGRTYARAGRAHDLVAEAGVVTAKVTGTRPTPYEVRITLAKLPDAAWDKATLAMATRAEFAAELLAGRMPKDIEVAFAEAGRSLFPAAHADLATECSCPDWANPCKHVAATHYVLGDAFDRDPFLLFEVRGRTKAQVLDALRAARTGGREEKAPSRGAEPAEGRPLAARVRLGKMSAADYDRPRGALPALHLSFDAPEGPSAVLRQLGAPAPWASEASPVATLGPVVRAAADRARALALGDAGEPEEVPLAPPPDATQREVGGAQKKARARAQRTSKRVRKRSK